MNRTFVRLLMLAVAAAGFSAGTGFAQYYRPGLPNPYGGGYQAPVYGQTGGALMGSAAMANAYGNVITSQEDARILREQANQAKIDTKRKAFDEMNYEKANTPSWSEKQSKIKTTTATRLMLQAQESEVVSGYAMNYVLPTLQSMILAQGGAPALPVEPSVVAKINVTVGDNGNSLGMFKSDAPLRWPYALLGPTQKKLDTKLKQAIYDTKQGAYDPTTIREVRRLNEQLLTELKKKLHAEDIDGGEYLESKHFIEHLTDGISGLGQPYAMQVLNGSYRAEGKSVPEIVMNMSRNGLRFAPATPGNEPAYFALHSAMAAFYQQGYAGQPTAAMYPR